MHGHESMPSDKKRDCAFFRTASWACGLGWVEDSLSGTSWRAFSIGG
jgi:hypothetical protein